MSIPRVAGPTTLALLAAVASAAAQGFDSQRIWAHGDTPLGLVVTDLDDDGHADLVTTVITGSFPTTFAIARFFGDGQGGFEPGVPIAGVGKPLDLAFGDVTGDGLADFLVMHQSPEAITVLPGDGAGGFLPAVETAVPWFPNAIALFDVDEDGTSEVLALRSFSFDGTIDLLRSDGVGALTVADSFALAVRPLEVAIGDVDLDGEDDVAVVCQGFITTQVAVLLDDGSDQLEEPALAPVQNFASATDIAIGDLDGDRVPDLVTCYSNGAIGRHAVFPDGNGGLSFVGPDYAATGTGPLASMALADLQGDGLLDVLACGTTLDGAAVLRGAGGGAFEPVQSLLGGSDPMTIALAEVGGGLGLDIVTCDEASDSLSVIYGDGAGGFRTLPTFACGDDASAVAAGDLDEDGAPDLVVASWSASTLAILLGDGAGGFAAPAFAPMVGASIDVVLADMDGDGALDAVATAGFSHVQVLLADGAGGFGPGSTAHVSDTAVTLAAGDLDADGDPDVIVGTDDHLGGSLLVLRNGGSGNLAEIATLPAFFGNQPGSVVLADMNDDGRLDVAAFADHGETYVALGDGALGFGPFDSVDSYNSYGGGFALLDLDGDGRRDEVSAGADFVSGSQHNALGVRRGTGGGAFTPMSKTEVQLLGLQSAIADLDGDGWRDVVFSHNAWDTASGPDAFTVALSDGAGGLSSIAQFSTHEYPLDAVSADFDLDGRPDVAFVGNPSGMPGRVSLHLNRFPHGVWADLGHALGGSAGEPRLDGSGTLTAGSPLSLRLDDARTNAALVLVLGQTILNAPFKGGVLVPHPTRLLSGLSSGANGFFQISTTWPSGVPSGLELILQFWIVDPAGPVGFAASNGLRARTP